MNNIINCLNEYTIYPKIDSDKYYYQGRAVPRVTEILSKMIHEEYLMNWANYLGLIKHTKVKDELYKAQTIGTYSHNNIEYFIEHDIFNKKELYEDLSDNNMINSIENCVQSFMMWWKDISTNKVDIIGMEQKLICKWYAGTYDLLININGKNMLVDFKTSNYISYKYFLQLSAYKYILNMNNINVDGCIILQVDKKNPSYEEYFLNFDIPKHKQFIDQCTNTFLSLVYGYYNILNVENMYNSIFKKK